MTSRTDIKKITEKIKEEYKPEKIILFGSYAWGKPRKWSDVDLFIVKKSKKRRIDREYELRKKISESDFPPLDLLVYTPEEVAKGINDNRNLFLEDIVRNGKILYAQKNSEIQIKHKQSFKIIS